MAGEVVEKQARLRVRVEQFVGSATEEATVRVERCLDQFGQELTEDASTVDASLVQTGKVHQSNLHSKLQIRLCNAQQYNTNPALQHSISECVVW